MGSTMEMKEVALREGDASRSPSFAREVHSLGGGEERRMVGWVGRCLLDVP
jgi:hypothetical protein